MHFDYRENQKADWDRPDRLHPVWRRIAGNFFRFEAKEKQMPNIGGSAPQGNAVLVFVLGCGGLVSAADNWIVAPILPSISDGLNVSIAQGAMVLTAYMIPYGAMQPVHGYLSERCGRVRLLRWLMLGLALGTIGCALSPSLIWLCAFRFMTGLAAAGMIAVSLALIGDRMPASIRQKYVGRFMGIVFLGQGLSVGFGGLLAKYVSWRIIFIVFAVMAIIVQILFSFLRDSPQGRSRSNFREQIVLTISSKQGRLIYLLSFMTGYLLLGIYSFSGAFLQQKGGLDPSQAGGVLMFFGFASLAAGSSMGWVTRITGTRGIAVIGSVFGLLAAVMLALSNDWRIGLLSIVTLGLGYVFIQSTMATLAFDVGSKGLSSGLVGLGLFGGGGVSSAVGGIILSQYGYETLWCVSGVGTTILIFAMLQSRRLFERTSGPAPADSCIAVNKGIGP